MAIDGRALANSVIEYANPGLCAQQIGETLLQLFYVLKCGSDVLAAADDWLLGSDHWRIEIRLSTDESFPSFDVATLRGHLERIAREFPDLAKDCARMISARTEIADV